MSNRLFPSDVKYTGIDVYNQPHSTIAYSCHDDIKFAIAFDNSLNENEVIAHIIHKISKIYRQIPKIEDDEVKNVMALLRNKN